ncbi:MAG: hypothetical protein PHO01_06280 [Desulfotomaculaceae bacterium]|nr:hypothetical protein [Desulfotomaculaceae bacterium]
MKKKLSKKDIQEELKNYKKLGDSSCPACGYAGPMGIIRVPTPKAKYKWINIFIFFIVLAGIYFYGPYLTANFPYWLLAIIFALAGGYLGMGYTAERFVCPQCKETVNPK